MVRVLVRVVDMVLPSPLMVKSVDAEVMMLLSLSNHRTSKTVLGGRVGTRVILQPRL